MSPNPAKGREDIAKARAKDQENESRMKRYKDATGYVKPHRIKVGHKELLEVDLQKKLPIQPQPL